MNACLNLDITSSIISIIDFTEMTQKPGAGTKQSSYVKAFQWANLILYMTEF